MSAERTDTDISVELGDMKTAAEDNGTADVEYSVSEIPPVFVLLTSAIQHLLMCLPNVFLFAFIVADVSCIPFDSAVRAQLVSAELFLCGLTTILQTFLGVRLPIMQGPSAAFIPTLLALQKNSVWMCADPLNQGFLSRTKLEMIDHDPDIPDMNTTHSMNTTNASMYQVHSPSSEEKLQQLSGSLMAASLVEILVGATGLVGLVMRFVGPITVAATVILLGLSLIKLPIMFSKASWELALCGALLAVLFGLYLRHKTLPIYNCRKKGEERSEKKKKNFPLFQQFPILLSIGIVWIMSAILTATNAFPADPNDPHYKARTDAKNNLLYTTPWFQISYPGQFGMPSFNVAIFIGFVTAFCASIVESVGDYLATARACHVTAPPDHAVNRGIMVEGIASLLSGAVGLGHATTSLSENVAVVAISGTCSRAILMCAGVMLLLISIVGKLGAAIATIPDPALGGVLIVLFGMLVSLGLSSLQHVKLSSRNVIILGLSLFVGIFLPEWINKGNGLINTGNEEVDGVLQIALRNPMLIGGVFALILDNTVRGTPVDRGVSHVNSGDNLHDAQMTTDVYSWSWFNTWSSRLKCCSKLPFMPPRYTNLLDDAPTERHTYSSVGKATDP